MTTLLFFNGSVVLPDQILDRSWVLVEDASIRAIGTSSDPLPAADQQIDLDGQYLAPGFVDLHVHGGDGADFMDGTEEAFRTVCAAHARHGTTSLLPTTTVGRHDQHLAFLNTCRKLKQEGTGSSRILGAHFYGPYFASEARGCHPGDPVRPPHPDEYLQYLSYQDCLCRATVAVELDGAEQFVHACRARGIGCNVGHSHATFTQVQQSLTWGVSHVDHLFCAMSDRAKLRLEQTYPMRGGVMEATLFFDQLTTEVIADGKHLCPELLLLAHKIKTADRLALVTDSNRALDMPDGDYIFGPADGGERIQRRDGVGIMPDGKSLASGVMGLDHCIYTLSQNTHIPLYEVVRMATLTPARIAGCEKFLGSISEGKLADLVVLDQKMRVNKVSVGGKLLTF